LEGFFFDLNSLPLNMVNMKHIAFLVVMAHTAFSYAQMQSLNCTSVSICSCPGEAWNISNINQPSVLFSASGVSKRVMFSKYGFTIPTDGNILGVEIQYTYSTTAPGTTLNDENILLLYYGNQAGIDRSSLTPVYSGSNTVVLGGPTDLWNWSLFPSDINADGFGFNFKLNSSAAGTQFNFINGAQITVYYQNPNGIIESQKSYSGSKISINQKKVDFISEYNQETEISIYNLLGERIAFLKSQNNESKEIDLSNFESGLYVYTVKTNGKEKTGKFLLD